MASKMINKQTDAAQDAPRYSTATTKRRIVQVNMYNNVNGTVNFPHWKWIEARRGEMEMEARVGGR